MIERLLENWLNSANERSFQIPFAHSLTYKGYKLIHVSRHCAMELGKDIIAIDPDDNVCAFQIKGVHGGGRLTLSAWRSDLGQQLHSLAYGQVVHPSISPPRPHRPFIVLNGDLDEEVQRELDDFNRTLVLEGKEDRQIRTIVKGQLLASFREMQSEFWPTNLHDIKTFLEITLSSGNGFMPKRLLEKLLHQGLSLHDEQAPSERQIVRNVLGTIMTCSTALKPFSEAKNYFAEFEAWTLCWQSLCAVESKWSLRAALLRQYKKLARECIFGSLANLCDELAPRCSGCCTWSFDL